MRVGFADAPGAIYHEEVKGNIVNVESQAGRSNESAMVFSVLASTF